MNTLHSNQSLSKPTSLEKQEHTSDPSQSTKTQSILWVEQGAERLDPTQKLPWVQGWQISVI